MKTCLPLICLFSLPTWASLAGQGADVYSPGEAFDIAASGFRTDGDDGRTPGVRWAEPRKVRRVRVEFDEGETLPAPALLQLQYWHRSWNGRADPPMAERGAGGVGWDAMDDWTNGRWITAQSRVERTPNGYAFTFAPVSSQEIKSAGDRGVTFRKTLAIRLACKDRLPPPVRFEAYTDSVAKPLRVRIQFGMPREPLIEKAAGETGYLEVFNGQVTAVRSVADRAAVVHPDSSWTLSDPAVGGIEADLLMAVDPIDERYDRTVVTARSSTRPFSFAADEVARGDRILVDDLGVLVTRAEDAISLEAYREILGREYDGRTIYDAVAAADEQTLPRAWDDMPLKRPLYFVHGLPGNRNTMRQNPNGEIEVTAVGRWFNLPRSPRDSDRKLWDGEWLRLSFGFPDASLRGGRELQDGYLPLLRTWWQAGSVYYEQKTILAAIGADPGEAGLDTPTVLLMRVRAANVSDSENAVAALRFGSSARREERLIIEDGRAVAVSDEGERLRFVVDSGAFKAWVQEGNRAVWRAELRPGESRTVYVTIPSVTLRTDEEIASLRALDFERQAARMCAFWRELTAQGTQVVTPEPWINDFYKAHLRHLLVNCFKERDTDLLHAHVGTFHYGVYPNESIMMISDLDRRGYYRQAQQNLDAFLHYQSTVSMPGNFAGADGQFYGAGGHETGGYNKSHGYVMWGMAQHWWFTRDRDWMDRAAPALAKACEWVTRERRATMVTSADGSRPLQYGWLPAGSLEDVTDYWYWLATNSATAWGFRALADALADFGHPVGKRLQEEADAYCQDVMRGVTASRIRCPVVRLRDATYVPKIPSRLYERGRAHGWLRETLEGALFLPAYGLLPPDAPETRWVLKDYEDNLYISDRYGYAIPAFDAFWFSRGGFSMQANLLDGPLPYLWRDDIKHYVRAYFNSFASAFYPELRMCNEHSLPELGYPRGDHFKTSDEAQSTYWLRLMFVNERDGTLYLGQAIPRYWLGDGNRPGIHRAASHFGPLSLQYESHVTENRIDVTLDPPTRGRPQAVYLRVRHPQSKPIQGVRLNGKPYDHFDRLKEWIMLPGALDGRQEIVVEY